VRAEPDKLQTRIVRLAVDQDEVWPDVAVAMIVPLATERMIEIAARQWFVLRQHRDGFEQGGIEALAVPCGFLASLVAAKAAGVFNNPHSGSGAVSPAGRLP
jgi:hypothetical protein